MATATDLAESQYGAGCSLTLAPGTGEIPQPSQDQTKLPRGWNNSQNPWIQLWPPRFGKEVTGKHLLAQADLDILSEIVISLQTHPKVRDIVSKVKADKTFAENYKALPSTGGGKALPVIQCFIDKGFLQPPPQCKGMEG